MQLPCTQPKEVTPLTRSAWMRFRDGCWWLCHVPHVRVEHSDLKECLGLDVQGWFIREKIRTPHGKYEHVQNVFKQKTAALGTAEKPLQPLQLFFSIAQAKVDGEHAHQRNTLSIRYRKVSDIAYQASAGYANGRLVVTGQPSDSKHMEFIFQVPSEAKWFKLDDSLMQDFLRINDTPETMLERFKNQETNPFGAEIGFPVFYLCKDRTKLIASNSSDIRAIGLSQMFRLPYKLSLGEAALQQQPALGAGRLDLARTLFGAVSEEIAPDGDQPQAHSRRSRISFGDCRLADDITGTLEAPAVFQRPTVLNGPKPSFYPNYINQEKSRTANASRDTQPSDSYSTLMDDKAELRGWKRYPVHNPAGVTDLPAPPDKSKADVQTRLNPLRSGLRFEGRIRLHNVTCEELGAIVWALTWGGDDTLRHSLGMGKPMGLGQLAVRLAPDSVHIRPNEPTAEVPDAKACQQAFEDWMSLQNNRWQASLGELLAMANPAAPGTIQLVPLSLNAGTRDNEFKLAKQAGAALAPYSRPVRRR